jgi:hypothetical protein
MALKDFTPLPGKLQIKHLDDKFEIEWDKVKYPVGVTEWSKQGHVIYKIKVSSYQYRVPMH